LSSINEHPLLLLLVVCVVKQDPLVCSVRLSFLTTGVASSCLTTEDYDDLVKLQKKVDNGEELTAGDLTRMGVIEEGQALEMRAKRE